MVGEQMAGIRRICVVLLFGFLGCDEGDKEKSVPILPDSEYDRVKLTDLKYNPIELKQYKGKTIFLNFWATWCKPCMVEMPSIERAQNILRNDKVVFLLASSESSEEIEAFGKNHDYNFNYVRIENIEDLNIQALPTTYVFSPDGKLVFSEMGYRKWDEKNNIDMILKTINR